MPQDPLLPCRLRLNACLTLLGLITGCAVLGEGGTNQQSWSVCVLGLGLLSVAASLWLPHPKHGLERGLAIGLAITAVCAALQVIPLPVSWVEILSPQRGELHRAVARATAVGSWTPLSVHPSATARHLVYFTACFAVFWLARSLTLLLGAKVWKAIVPVLLIAGFQAAHGWMQYGPRPSPVGVSGSYVNPNHFAGLLEMALPFAASAILLLGHRVHAEPRRLFLLSLLTGAAGLAALLVFGIALSYSRAGFAASALSLCLLGVLVQQSHRHRRPPRGAPLFVVLATLVGFALLAPRNLTARFAQVATLDGILSEGRMELWQETLKLVRAYPVFGCGLGAFSSAFLPYKKSAPLHADPYAHNDYLQYLAEFGVVGSAALLLTLGFLLRGLLRTCRRPGCRDVRLLAAASVASITAMLIHSAFDFNLYIPANGLVFAWVLGLSAALAPPHENPRTSQRPSRKAKPPAPLC